MPINKEILYAMHATHGAALRDAANQGFDKAAEISPRFHAAVAPHRTVEHENNIEHFFLHGAPPLTSLNPMSTYTHEDVETESDRRIRRIVREELTFALEQQEILRAYAVLTRVWPPRGKLY